MKITVLFLAVLGLCHGATYILEKHTVVLYNVQTKNLDDLLQQFVAMIPFDQCVEIVNKYIANDPDVKQAYDFLRSDKFESMLVNLEQLPEYKEFVQYLYDSGFDYYKYLNIIREILNLPPRPRPPRAAREDSGIIKMIQEVLATLPIDDMRTWYVTVCVPDPDFQALLARIRSPEFFKLVQYVYTSPEYLEMKEILLSQGIDVDQIEEAIADFLNNAKRTRRTKGSIDHLIQQFFAMIPMDKIMEIAQTYVNNDPDVKAAFEFLQTPEFQELSKRFIATQEFQDFAQYMRDSGLNIAPSSKHSLKHRHGYPRSPKENGLTRMYKEILATFPMEEIKEWYFSVCVKDPDFQFFAQRIKAPEFKQLLANAMNTVEYKDFVAANLAHGIDSQEIWAMIKDAFSWVTLPRGRSSLRNLDDLLQQFASFIPFDECVAIVKKYLENDKDVQQAWQFLQSEEFQSLRDKVRSMQEYKDFVKYLSDAGLDLYAYINIIRKAFGLPPISPPRHFRIHRAESGIIVMIKEMLATLPVDDIKAWFYDVCIKDPSFIDFVNKIQSPEFLKIVESVYGSQEYKDMTDIMRAQGIDVDQIEQVIRDFLEGNIGPRRHIGARNLDDLLQQFASFIPFDECVAIVKKYLENDKDVQQAWQFLQSEEFQSLRDKVRSMQEYKDFVKYLSDAGLDLYAYINIIRKAFGLPPISPPRHFRIHRAESGIIVMIKEMLATLPVDDIKAWFYDVCIKDPSFIDFVNKIQSPEFLKIVESVYGSQEYKDMTDIMRAQGIDVDQIEQVIRDFLEGNIGPRRHIGARNLDDLLQQFASFIPFDECVAIVKKYLENDKDVQQAWQFLQSEEFQSLRDKVRSMQEYKDFVKYLSDAGLDLYAYINIIRKAFGLPPISPPRHFRIHRAESGIIVMIKEMLATLPVDDIKAWFYDVCIKDPSFIDFVNKIQSPEFLKIVESVYGSQEYKDMTDIMRAQGIDVDQIEQVIRDFLEGNIGPRRRLGRMY